MNTRRQDLSIASGATVSSQFNAGGFSAFGAVFPSNLTGTAVTFEVGVSASGTGAATGAITWTTLNTGTAATSLTVAASKAYKLPDDLRPWEYWRFICPANSSGAATVVVFGKSEA